MPLADGAVKRYPMSAARTGALAIARTGGTGACDRTVSI